MDNDKSFRGFNRKVMSDARFNAEFDRFLRSVKSEIAEGVESVAPMVLALYKTGSGYSMAVIAFDIDHDSKYEVAAMIGANVVGKKEAPLAALFFKSEAWMSKDPTTQPRFAEDRVEGVLISALTPDYRYAVCIMTMKRDGENCLVIDGEPGIQYWNGEDGEEAVLSRNKILGYMMAGYVASKQALSDLN